jgi:hypothetical protein
MGSNFVTTFPLLHVASLLQGILNHAPFPLFPQDCNEYDHASVLVVLVAEMYKGQGEGQLRPQRSIASYSPEYGRQKDSLFILAEIQRTKQIKSQKFTHG